jgi:hypothetical protein
LGRKSGGSTGIGETSGNQKKKMLTEAVEKLVEEEGHHSVDAEGMVGLESRPVTEAMIDEVMDDVDVEVGDGD